VRKQIVLGRRRPEDLDGLLSEARGIAEIGEGIAFISGRFLGTPYQERTLVGDVATPEVFVVNLAAVDCFTFIDYVEAMRLSGSFKGFMVNLRRVRYRGGRVAYTARNHFFTDWIGATPRHVKDVTAAVGRGREVTARKELNRKADGGLFLSGIGIRARQVTYIPAVSIGGEVTRGLATGDYIGVYTEEAGLDVSHVGIVIREGSSLLLRHASSQEGFRRVIDSDLAGYLAEKPGIVVLRPIPIAGA
jgi:hypothetical protein